MLKARRCGGTLERCTRAHGIHPAAQPSRIPPALRLKGKAPAAKGGSGRGAAAQPQARRGRGGTAGTRGDTRPLLCRLPRAAGAHAGGRAAPCSPLAGAHPRLPGTCRQRPPLSPLLSLSPRRARPGGLQFWLPRDVAAGESLVHVSVLQEPSAAPRGPRKAAGEGRGGGRTEHLASSWGKERGSRGGGRQDAQPISG